MKNYKKILAAIAFCLFLSAAIAAQSGGNFAIKQGTISSGGGDSGGGAFGAKGTAGQPVAGARSTGGQFGVAGGFWANALPPTAAGVSISGRVTTPNGNGLRNAIVVLTDSQGLIRRTITGSFGYYRFDDIPAGETCVIAVTSKRFQFTPRILSVTDELTEIDFVGFE